ncbi:MAG: iron transporter [Halobacteriota archaeon]
MTRDNDPGRSEPTTNRRRFLGAVGAVGTASLAGCSDLLQWQSPYAPPVVEDRPDAVYHPTHTEEMVMVGMKTAGPYGCALSYGYPHRFWLVTGTRTERVSIQEDDSVHLMATIWDRESGIVLPDASPDVAVTVGEETVTSLNPWSMLSQQMGFHFGDNVTLPGDGSYDVEIGIAPPSLPRSETMPAAPAERTNCTFEFEYDRAERDDLSVTEFPEKQGDPGALPAMDMSMTPTSTVPATGDLPGRTLGSATSGDAAFVATIVDDAARFGGSADQSYLAVSPRTPHNRFGLPFMSLSASLDRDGSAADVSLDAALDPMLSLHYGAVVAEPVTGTDLTVTVETPPQVSRHEGYETAFLEMPTVEFTV